jgi:hypothetical protein
VKAGTSGFVIPVKAAPSGLVIPAKAGIHLLPTSPVLSLHSKIDNMDSRFRGNDDGHMDSRFRGNDDARMMPCVPGPDQFVHNS